jgi:predicted membrane chloride channel (bestrophin family)
MTVIYDAKDHFSVICSLHGSILPRVLPWCLWNTAVLVVVWLLQKHGIIDLSFHGGVGYQFLSVLVSFFVVSNVNTTYNRFWEARGHLGNALNAVTMLAARAAIYSRKETHARAKAWRAELKRLIIDMVKTATFSIQDERAAYARTSLMHQEKKKLLVH